MINIIIAGDFYPQSRVAELIDKERYKDVFGEVKPIIENSDYAIVNFECPVVLNSAMPICKTGPNLKCAIHAVEALDYAGFKMAALANNHIYDYGDVGVKDTLSTFEKFGIDVVGAGINLQEAQKIYFKQIENKTFAFINFCENEFSIATDKSGGASPLDLTVNYYQIQKARQKADYVIVIIHGGHEHFQYPSFRMKNTYRFFVDVGADVIINHHQHCYSGYEVYNEKPIFYGLGNFSFDDEKRRNSIWNEGYMVDLKFNENKINFSLIPYMQGDEKAGVTPIKDTDMFFKNIDSINSVIENDKLLDEKLSEYYMKSGRGLSLLFEPFQNRIINGLRRRSLFPRFISKSKWNIMRNIIECESHRDKIIGYFKNK